MHCLRVNGRPRHIPRYTFMSLSNKPPCILLRGLSFMWWGCCGLCKPTELAHSVLLFLCLFMSIIMALSTVFHSINSPWQLSAFSLCSSRLISTLLVLSTVYICVKLSFSPDTILCGWLGLQHQLNDYFTSAVPHDEIHALKRAPFTY